MTRAGADPDQPSPRWGMVIDVNRCVGCQTCTIACKHANDTTPGVQWRQVLDVEQGEFPDVERLFLVVGCQHCAEPPCVPVCPTGATRQRADGLVTMDYDTCIGCGYCAVACPYQARTIVHEQKWYYGEETRQEQAVRHDDRIGVAQKCTFCDDRIEQAEPLGLTPGVDPEVTPVCSASCIAQAIHFGDFNDPTSNVAELIRDNDHFQMHAELGTDPQIKYLYETPAVPGRDPAATDHDEDRQRDPANPLVGSLQEFWDWKAAMNWSLGGIGSGFAFIGWLAYLAGDVALTTLPYIQSAAALVIAVGLFFVFLKIGRKLRFWRAVLRPQTSWMTRELYASAVFYPAVLASLVWPEPGIVALAAVAALAFLYCQARILHAARGVPAWRVRLMPPMLVAAGLLDGTALLALAQSLTPTLLPSVSFVALVGIVLALLNAGLWTAYRRGAERHGIGPLARDAIDETTLPLHLVGHAVPVVLFAVALAGTAAAPVALGIGGVAALAGGAYWKFRVILKASYQQGFAMAKIPRRGSGARAAPTRLGVDRAV